MKTLSVKFLIGLLLAGLAFSPACKTPPDRLAVTAAQTVTVTVDAAMQAWRDEAVAGKVTQAQLDAVKRAYQKYYDAALLERDALQAYATVNTNGTPLAFIPSLQTIVSDALSAKTDLLNLVTQFLPPAKVAALKGATK